MASLSNGRFINKRDQERYPEIEVLPFNFGDLADTSMIIPDNPRKSMVQRNLHTEEELAAKVRESEQFRTPLVPHGKTLFPQDLNEDYKRTLEELRIKNRRKMMDEEEAVAQELADMMERNRDKLEQVSWKVSSKNQDAQPAAQRATHSTAAAEMADAAAARPEALHAAANMANAAGVREVYAPTTPAASAPAPSNAQPQVIDQAMQHFHAAQNEVEVERLRAEIWAQIRDEAYEEGFAKGREDGIAAGKDEGIVLGKEEASKTGFEEGFRNGEQRGEIAGEAKVDKTLSLLAEVMHHIDLLRSEILASGQEIFVEFAKAAAESILRTQLTVQDSTLRDFLVQTMTPFSEKPFLNIEVNGIDAKRISQVLSEYPDLQKKVKVRDNKELPIGDFRVEADNEVVIVDLKKAVSDFMDSIKNEILATPNDKQGAA